MAYTYEQLLAVDPSNPANVARAASITIFAPGDAAKTPLTITDTNGAALANPLTSNANGFAPAFIHATLDRVAWEGGGLTGFLTSYEGMKEEAVAARAAAESAGANAGAAAVADVAARIAGGEFKGEPGADGSNVLPTDTAIKDAINNAASATRGALNAAYAAKADLPTEKVLALGTSIAAAVGASSTANAYPAKTATYLNTVLGETYEVIPAGVSGNTVSSMLTRLPALLDEHKPSFVTIEVSVNDARIDLGTPQSHAMTVANLRKIIAKVRLARAIPILITNTWFDPVVFNAAQTSYNASSVTKAAANNVLARELARELNVRLVDMYDIQPKDTSMLFDGLHPNDTGHDLWGKHVANAIAQQGGYSANRTYVRDDFNRADNATTLGTALTGQTWQAEGVGVWGVSGNAAYSASATDSAIAFIEAGAADMTVTASAIYNVGLVARYADSLQYYLLECTTAGVFTIYRRKSGGFDTLATLATGIAKTSTEKISLTVRGTQLIASRDGAYVLAAEDSVHRTGTKAGFRQMGGNTAANRWDNFTITS